MAIESSDIETTAEGPKRVQQVGEGMVEERDVDELIKADRYNRSGSAVNPPWGMRIARAKPSGTLGYDALD